MALFALAVTASVQLVGVYLVFSSLIVPALATRAAARGARLCVAYAIGVAGYALGLALSAVFDLPSGAVIVWTLGGVRTDLEESRPRSAAASRPFGRARYGSPDHLNTPESRGLRRRGGRATVC